VWAYGIVLWELFEYGKGSLLLSGSGDWFRTWCWSLFLAAPYPNMDNATTRDQVLKGYRYVVICQLFSTNCLAKAAMSCEMSQQCVRVDESLLDDQPSRSTKLCADPKAAQRDDISV
jgi:hypothetical protein